MSASNPLTKTYRSYFTPSEVSVLSARQRGKQSTARDERGKQIACGFIDAVGIRCGFPRRTIATAQSLYFRFHLFFPLTEFPYLEVTLTCLYVSSKLHDTLKKPREIILASYPLRYPDLLKGRAQLDPSAVDQKQLEQEKKKVQQVERLVLETICFNFLRAGEGAGSGKSDTFGLGVKVGRKMGFSKRYIQHAWRIIIDTFRTPSPLLQTPSTIALSSLYLTSLLLLHPTVDQSTEDIEWKEELRRGREKFENEREWEEEFGCGLGAVDEVVHSILDAYIILLTSLIPIPIDSTPLTSPHSPSDSQPAAAGTTANQIQNRYLTASFPLPAYWTSSTLTQLKIQLHQSRAEGVGGRGKVDYGFPGVTARDGKDEAIGKMVEGLGKNESTVRFVFA